jgi:hypothetical protein
MMHRVLLCVITLVSMGPPAAAVEIATGKMLGPKFDQRSFYLRETGGKWRKTYTGKQYRPEAAGRLMNLRIAQALFHDEWLTEFPFDVDKNTDAVIAALDTWGPRCQHLAAVRQSGIQPRVRRDQALHGGQGRGWARHALRRVSTRRLDEEALAGAAAAVHPRGRSARHDRRPDVLLPVAG